MSIVVIVIIVLLLLLFFLQNPDHDVKKHAIMLMATVLQRIVDTEPVLMEGVCCCCYCIA